MFSTAIFTSFAREGGVMRAGINNDGLALCANKINVFSANRIPKDHHGRLIKLRIWFT